MLWRNAVQPIWILFCRVFHDLGACGAVFALAPRS
jgi:hypothetical protein